MQTILPNWHSNAHLHIPQQELLGRLIIFNKFICALGDLDSFLWHDNDRMTKMTLMTMTTMITSARAGTDCMALFVMIVRHMRQICWPLYEQFNILLTNVVNDL